MTAEIWKIYQASKHGLKHSKRIPLYETWRESLQENLRMPTVARAIGEKFLKL
jgi:hypothetical protein